MPRLWSDTIGEHRETVRRTLLEAAGELVDAHGLAGVTMSRLAQRSGVGRATVYKYFPDAAAVLDAWHEQLVGEHLERLRAARDRTSAPGERLDAVLAAYAQLMRSPHSGELVAALHSTEHVARARQHVAGILAEVLSGAAAAGLIRDDRPMAELAAFCRHALAAAAELPEAGRDRLVDLVREALGPSETV